MADPNGTTCAACGAAGELHEHHLVPRVCEGMALPTVMLCTACHSLVHGRAFPVNHAELTRRGLAAAKARGQKLGNPNGARVLKGRGNAEAVAALKSRAADHAARVRPIVEAIRAEGLTSFNAIAGELNRRGVLTANGGQWHATTVRNLLLREAANG